MPFWFQLSPVSHLWNWPTGWSGCLGWFLPAQTGGETGVGTEARHVIPLNFPARLNFARVSAPALGRCVLQAGVVGLIGILAVSGNVASAPLPDDHDGLLGPGATPLTLGSSHSGRLDFPGDRDVFRFDLPAGPVARDVWFHTSGPVNDTVGALFDSQGNEVASNDDSVLYGPGTHFHLGKTLGPGAYYIVVSGRGDATGQYTLHSRYAADHRNYFANAIPLPLDSPVDGNIDNAQDRDLFRLDLSAVSGPVRLATYSTGDVDTVGTLYTPAGDPIVSNDDSQLSNNRINFFAAAVLDPGVYYLAVSGYGDASGPYRVHATNVPDQEHGSNRLVSLPPDGSALAWLSSFNDGDRFEIDLAAETGNTDLWLYSAGSAETYAELYRGDQMLASNDNSVFSPNRRNFLIAESLPPATYQLHVSAAWTDFGPYRVFASHRQDPGNDVATAGQLSPDAPELGLLVPGDGDLYQVDLSAAAGATDLLIYSTGDVDTSAVLLDSDGTTVLAQDADSGDGSNFRIRSALAAGVYYIRVVGQDNAQRGPYVLHANTFGALPLGGAAPGDLQSIYDEQLFRLDISTAQDVWIYADTDPQTGSAPDTAAKLYDAALNQIANNDDGSLVGRGGGFSILTALSPGTYYLRVSGKGEAGPYVVRAAAVTEPGSSVATASALPVGVPVAGRIPALGDASYFRLSVDRDMFLLLYSRTSHLTGQLLDANGALIEQGTPEYWGDGFVIRERVAAGTFYLKVSPPGWWSASRYPARFVAHAVEDPEYARFADRCAGQVGEASNPAVTDDLYGCQWHLNNRADVDEDINVEPAWAQGIDGSGVNVVVVDDGMDYLHDDLIANVDVSRNHNYADSGDIGDTNRDHGTGVAGIIAASANRVGIRGVAPGSTMYGYNFLAYATDSNMLDAMTRNRQVTAVSNNSWGGRFDARLSDAPSLWEQAVESGITEGYDGKGTFYAFAAGNGALSGGLANLSEFTSFYAVTAVCAVNDHGVRSRYSHTGAPLWVCAPSSDGSTERGIWTTANRDRYRDDFGGTSAATPMVSGVAALLRQANSQLSWRDLKLILAASARKNDPDHPGWLDGAPRYLAGSSRERYAFNHEYGFGVVDAGAAVNLADNWVSAPPLLEIAADADDHDIEIPDFWSEEQPVQSAVQLGTDVTFTEFVEVNVSLRHRSFRDLRIDLVSPSGTVSNLLEPFDTSYPIRLETSMRLGSARHLGENPNGWWVLRVSDGMRSYSGTLESWSIKVYGHQSVPGPVAIESVIPGDSALTVNWRAPVANHRPDSTWYDVRYIQASEDASLDANWRLLENAWQPGDGDLTRPVDGLSNNVRYVVQVRAVNQSGSGPWSTRAAATPVVAAPACVPTGDAEVTMVSNQAQNRNGNRELKESTPVIGQIFRTGCDRARYELTEITSRFDNTSRTHKFNLKVSLHEVTSDSKPGAKIVDLVGDVQARKTNLWSPTHTTILKPNTRYMIVFRCNAGDNNDQNCNGSGEEIEIKLTDSDAEDNGKSDGWSIANNLYMEDADGNSSTHLRSARIEVKGHSAGIPYIVSNGIRMYDVKRSEAGGWDIRPPGDDTYGGNELIVVAVEFSEPVRADRDSSFRIKLNSGFRDLSPVRTRGNTVLFGTLVRPQDDDPNGIWIGNGAKTLAHNTENAIHSVADPSRNADLTHPRVGTQSDHRVKGNATRARLRNIAVTSSPQHSRVYAQGETITFEARFDRPVDVTGAVQLRLNVDALHGSWPGHARYTGGSGTSILSFEHVVTPLEQDTDGIEIPTNALAQDGKLAWGANGGGSIVGRQDGLIADLANRKRGPMAAHQIDGTLATVP